MGVLMRFYVVVESLEFNYKYLLHAHSHVAFLGWIYIGLTTLIIRIFLKNKKKAKRYQQIFLFTNMTLVGMLIAFPIQGYGLFSILFSTLFLFASYWFSGFMMKNVPEEFKQRFSWKMIKSSLWYLVFSSIGPWAIGAVMATLGSESIWYKTSIYFYLHFQYNGWFVFALLGIFFYILEEAGIELNPSLFKSFYFLTHLGVILTFLLSVLWFKPPLVFYIFGTIGAIVQAQAVYELYLLLKPNLKQIRKLFPKQSVFLLYLAAFLTLFKLLMQYMSGHTYYAELAYRLKDFVIGYLHMVFLGIIIPALLVFLKYFKLIRVTNTFLILFLSAVFITEFLIFYRGFSLWLKSPITPEYYSYLAGFSCIFLLAIGILIIVNLENNEKKIPLK